MYRLLHTQVGFIGDERALFFEDALTYIADEETGGIFLVEPNGRNYD